jgi:hypothetical protein
MYDSEPAAKAARLLRKEGDPRAGRLRAVDADCPVRFLDAVAELPAGPAVLARLCGTPIVPFSCPISSALVAEIGRPLPARAERGRPRRRSCRARRPLDDARQNADHWAAVYRYLAERSDALPPCAAR